MGEVEPRLRSLFGKLPSVEPLAILSQRFSAWQQFETAVRVSAGRSRQFHKRNFAFDHEPANLKNVPPGHSAYRVATSATNMAGSRDGTAVCADSLAIGEELPVLIYNERQNKAPISKP